MFTVEYESLNVLLSVTYCCWRDFQKSIRVLNSHWSQWVRCLTVENPTFHHSTWTSVQEQNTSHNLSSSMEVLRNNLAPFYVLYDHTATTRNWDPEYRMWNWQENCCYSVLYKHRLISRNWFKFSRNFLSTSCSFMPLNMPSVPLSVSNEFL